MTTLLHVACYNDLKAWAKKHRRRLLVAAGVVGAGIGTYYFVNSMKARAKAREEREERQSAILRKEAEDRAEAQLQSHFESIQRISDSTTLPSVLPHLKTRLFELVNLSGLTEKLMSGKEDPQILSPREKLQLWQELKILSFTRTVCAMWSVTLLDLLIRTQLNILGRHVYIDTAREMSVVNDGDLYKPLSMSCQHKFIAFADYLPHKGIDGLIRDVHTSVESIMKSKPLKEPYRIADLRDVFLHIQQSFQKSQGNWVQYVLPEDGVLPDDLAAASSAADAARSSASQSSIVEDEEKLEQLMLETRNVLTSNEFADVLAAGLDAVLEAVLEDLSTIYRGNLDAGIPLAKLLPPVASTGSTLMEHPDDNRYIQILAQLPQVQSFCALVYSSNTGEDLG
ncbi:hypothetical protein R1flu_025094 [Riccia fluitans]|uniref:Peroxin-3 n=1 Tax=Riccia fluitans TaxID=41844 RepID=A0ABD1XWR8_9MARC